MNLYQVAIVTFLGALAAYAVKEVIDLVIDRLWSRRRETGLSRIERDLSRELDRERTLRRISLYRDFVRNVNQAVAELSIGTTRMAYIYAARDFYREISRIAPKEVASAARRMCRTCEEIMLRDFTETRYNQYQRYLKEFTDACIEDTGHVPDVSADEQRVVEMPDRQPAADPSPAD